MQYRMVGSYAILGVAREKQALKQSRQGRHFRFEILSGTALGQTGVHLGSASMRLRWQHFRRTGSIFVH